MFVHSSDHNFNYLMNALFTPLDMTDYENTFVGWNEINGSLPISNYSLLKPLMEEPWPTNHSLVAIESVEAKPRVARSNLHRDLMESKGTAEEEDEDSGMEEYGEEVEGAGGEEVEGEEDAAEEEADEEPAEEEEYPPPERIPHIPLEDKYFVRGENLRNKFNEIELDSFMRLLNVKPYKQWQDKSIHHYKLGTHTYEDDA